MSSETLSILGAMITQGALGLTVFLANRRNKSNDTFLILSVAAIAWLACLYIGSTTTKVGVAIWCVRVAYAAGAVILAIFYLLALSILDDRSNWPEMLPHCRMWIVATVAPFAFCQTSLFVPGARFSPSAHFRVLEPIYGYPGVVIYGVYFGVATIALVVAALRDLRRATGAA